MDLCTECTESNLICTMSECKKLCYHIEEDNFFNYMKKVQLPTTQRDECNRHQNGMLIPAEKVQVYVRV